MLYDIATTPSDLGRRCARLRVRLGLTVGDVARRTGFRNEDIVHFERAGEGDVSLLLALSRELASGDEVDRLLTTPKFDSLDEVEAYERRRIGSP